MLGSNYWNGDTSLFFGVENQALVSSQCSLETSCYSSSLNSSTSKLYLVPRRGWAQRMEMLPTFRENSPSSKHLQDKALQSGGRTHASGMVGILHCGFIAQRRSELASFSHKCAIYSRSRTPGSW
jgi:hypothetical protein